MNARSTRLIRQELALLLLLAGCSGEVNVDFDGPDVPDFPPLPVSEPISAKGPITGFADISVNGIRYSTGLATVSMNGTTATVADLKRGQIVTITGRVYRDDYSGLANTIRFDADVIGPISNIDADNSRITALNQVVRTDSNTVFPAGIDPDSYAGLGAGDIIEVSGLRNSAGEIRATRIDLAASVDHHVIGRVSSVDPATFRLTISGLAVDYSNAILIELPGGAPAPGMMIKVVGSMANGIFLAGRLKSVSGMAGTTGRHAQVAGLITRLTSSTDFEINGTPVSAGTGTRYVNGDRNDTRLDAEVLVDGDFGSSGRIEAGRVTFGYPSQMMTILNFDIADFTEITVPTVFSVRVTRGAEFSVTVRVDAAAASRVEVSRTGALLSIGLRPGDDNIQVLDAEVVMPVLDRIELTGVVNATLVGFEQSHMTVQVGGVSRLHSRSLKIEALTARVSGVSMLDFGNIHPLAVADIQLSGVSQAMLNMSVASTLTGSVSTGQGSGVSVLYYYGTDVFVDIVTDWLSNVIRLGDTQL